jgi:hypothetical protein
MTITAEELDALEYPLRIAKHSGFKQVRVDCDDVLRLLSAARRRMEIESARLDDAELVRVLTEVMREADRDFERVGVRLPAQHRTHCLAQALEKRGLVVSRELGWRPEGGK